VDCQPFGTAGKCAQATTRIAIGDLSGNTLSGLTPLVEPQSVFQLDPALAPGGTRIAFADFSKGIMTMGPDGGNLGHVDGTNPRDRFPSWRPPLTPVLAQTVLSVNSVGLPRFTFGKAERVYGRVTAPAGLHTVC